MSFEMQLFEKMLKRPKQMESLFKTEESLVSSIVIAKYDLALSCGNCRHFKFEIDVYNTQ